MLSESKLRELPEPAQTYWRRAQQFVEKSGDGQWFWIEPGMTEWQDWMRYFDFLDWEPFGVKEWQKGKVNGLVVPTQVPEWFDAEYAARRKDGVEFKLRPRLQQKLDDVQRPKPEPGRRANLFIHPKGPRYAEVIEWTKSDAADPADWRMGELRGVEGVWISLSIWITLFNAHKPKPWKSPDASAIRASLMRMAHHKSMQGAGQGQSENYSYDKEAATMRASMQRLADHMNKKEGL